MNLLKSKIPSASSYGDWLRRYGRTGTKGFKAVIDNINKKALLLDKNTEYTVFVDPILIETDKLDAFMTYKGFKGYRPWVATFFELPIIIYHEFCDGGKMGGVAVVLKNIFNLMPKGKRIKHVSLDSEFYTNEVIEFLTEKNVAFSISADKIKSLKDTIKSIKDWDKFKTADDILTDRQIGENIFCMKKSNPFRVIVLKWLSEANLFKESCYNYHVIATNLECPKEEVIYEYNKRVSIENLIKELKIGIGLENIPTGYFLQIVYSLPPEY